MSKITLKKVNIKNYLLLRIKLEEQIDKLKETIKNNLKNYKLKISEIKNISLQKIDFNITLYKSLFKNKMNIEELSDNIYDNLLRTFDYDVQKHYKLNENLIKDYIRESINNQIELKNLRNSIRNGIKKYREENKGSINFNAAETAFVEMRRNLKEAKKDKKYLKELQECREIANVLIIDELDSPKNIEVFNMKVVKEKPKKFTEKEILEILMGNKEIMESINKL